MKTTSYKNRYNSEHYDRIYLMLPKGEKERLKILAASQGISLNEYIIRQIRSREDELLEKMQIAEKYRAMVRCIAGSRKEGYTVYLNIGYVYSETGADNFYCRTKAELRKEIKKCLAQDM